MRFNCFNCGALLPPNSLKCPECGYCPDIEFMRRCPNLRGAVCTITNEMCHHLGQYQVCPVKNEADAECSY